MKRGRGWTALLLFGVLLLVYHANSLLVHPGDSPANVAAALSLAEDGDYLIRPTEAPLLFQWRLKTSKGSRIVHLPEMDEQLLDLIDRGTLAVSDHYPQLVPSRLPGSYLSTFGGGSATVAAPFYWLAEQLLEDVREDAPVLWWIGRFVGAASVAGSAVFLFLFADAKVSRFAAVAISLCYGLGTCVWSTSSQALWQHGPNELLAAATFYALSRSAESRWAPFWCGLSVSAATWCRPTSALLAAVLLGWYLLQNRGQTTRYLLGVVPLAAALALFNAYHLGSPFKFGQGEMGRLAVEKAGGQGVFQTPILIGAAGLLFSPARGLFVYSPFLVFAAWGAAACWRRDGEKILRPITVAIACIWGIEFKHFDWWGGWSYGYRHLVDTAIALCFLIVPLLPRIMSQFWLKSAFVGLAAWSIAVQALGIYAYDIQTWNARQVYMVTLPDGSIQSVEVRSEADEIALKSKGSVSEVSLDVDQPANRSRLWSWCDNQILYCLKHLSQDRERRRASLRIFLDSRSKKLASTHATLGRLFLQAGDDADAAVELQRALDLGSEDPELTDLLRRAKGAKQGALKGG